MTTKRTCPACDKAFLKGRRVLFNARTGARMAIVCQACASAALLVVADKSGDLSQCVYCEKNPAVACMACAKGAAL